MSEYRTLNRNTIEAINGLVASLPEKEAYHEGFYFGSIPIMYDMETVGEVLWVDGKWEIRVVDEWVFIE